ncbi:hypothetical protein HK099_004530 [Clydaea vesicula]|uniref:F-box domain-containing protein n=1 Tax=Clydaea vesicula TaxID=447962 RepID=A0AAD5Y081_9FUNG|nr:hypothetical protein HK099_004530 [Clydaea vesicula]
MNLIELDNFFDRFNLYELEFIQEYLQTKLRKIKEGVDFITILPLEIIKKIVIYLSLSEFKLLLLINKSYNKFFSTDFFFSTLLKTIPNERLFLHLKNDHPIPRKRLKVLAIKNQNLRKLNFIADNKYLQNIFQGNFGCVFKTKLFYGNFLVIWSSISFLDVFVFCFIEKKFLKIYSFDLYKVSCIDYKNGTLAVSSFDDNITLIDINKKSILSKFYSSTKISILRLYQKYLFAYSKSGNFNLISIYDILTHQKLRILKISSDIDFNFNEGINSGAEFFIENFKLRLISGKTFLVLKSKAITAVFCLNFLTDNNSMQVKGDKFETDEDDNKKMRILTLNTSNSMDLSKYRCFEVFQNELYCLTVNLNSILKFSLPNFNLIEKTKITFCTPPFVSEECKPKASPKQKKMQEVSVTNMSPESILQYCNIDLNYRPSMFFNNRGFLLVNDKAHNSRDCYFLVELKTGTCQCLYGIELVFVGFNDDILIFKHSSNEIYTLVF